MRKVYKNTHKHIYNANGVNQAEALMFSKFTNNIY